MNIGKCRFEVLRNNSNSLRSIAKIRKIVQVNDDLIFYRKPSLFSFTKEEENFQVIIENINNTIRPEDVIDIIKNDEQKDDNEEYSSKNFKIKSQFLFTWDEIERFYRFSFIDRHCEWKSPALEFIKELRRLEYDKVFRAGQQLSIFILSRCLNHGMREETNHLRIVFFNDNKMEVKTMSNGREIQKEILEIEVNDDLITILEKMRHENEIK